MCVGLSSQPRRATSTLSSRPCYVRQVLFVSVGYQLKYYGIGGFHYDLAVDDTGHTYAVTLVSFFIVTRTNISYGRYMEGRALRIGLADAQVFGERNVIADRRAISANLEWSQSNETSITNHLIKRAFKLAEKLRPYDVTPGPFQEPLNFIQYAHGGEYRPHCDGDCGMRSVRSGRRVASSLLYCEVSGMPPCSPGRPAAPLL